MKQSFAEAALHVVRALRWGDGPLPVVTYAGQVLMWRHHGLGMLQAELSETLRLHIWHPALVSPAMAWPRCVHDHRFDITSAVVLGSIRDVVPDVRFECLEHSASTWQRAKVYEIEHAKTQDRLVTEKGCSTATSALLLGEVMLSRFYAKSTTHEAGSVYEIKRRVFHTTEVDDLALTVVHRSNFDDKLARVLCAPDSDVHAVSGIVRDKSLDHRILVNNILRKASDAIAELG